MSHVFLILSLCICTIHASEPSFPHKASLVTTSSQEISYNDVVHVTYTLWQVPSGYYYIGLQNGYFHAIGLNHWAGFLKPGERKQLEFTLKLKDDVLVHIPEKVPLFVGFCYGPKPITNPISLHEAESLLFTLRDYPELVKSLGPRRQVIDFIPKAKYDSSKAKMKRLKKFKP